jgi:hypothetical protein
VAPERRVSRRTCTPRYLSPATGGPSSQTSYEFDPGIGATRRQHLLRVGGIFGVRGTRSAVSMSGTGRIRAFPRRDASFLTSRQVT